MKTFRIILFLFMLPVFPLPAEMNPFGRYIGYVRHEKLQQDQLAKLDLIFNRQEGNEWNLQAVLTLHFGDFATDEYVSYHYDKVRYSLITDSLVFDQSDQGLTVVVEKFSKGNFVGQVRSDSGKFIGSLVMGKKDPPRPELPLIGPLFGEYRGICERVEKTLQLYTYRSSRENQRSGNSFDAYEVRGHLGVRGRGLCELDPFNRPCVDSRVLGATYDFFHSDLSLNSWPEPLSCTTQSNGIRCNGCLLKRQSMESSELKLTPSVSEPVFGNSSMSEKPLGLSPGIRGEYSGYLHHETLNVYQPAALSIVTYPEDNSGLLQMSSVAALYFGAKGSREYVSYRFGKTQYALFSPVILFSNTDMDAILQVTSLDLSKGIVKGQWFSRIFGRVGTFELSKSEDMRLPPNTKVISQLSGEYVGESRTSRFPRSHTVRILTSLGHATSLSHNPLTPLILNGYVGDGGTIIPNRPIQGGSYDFFTGKLGVEAEGDIVAVGRKKDKNLELKVLYLKRLWSAPILFDHFLQPFQLQEPN